MLQGLQGLLRLRILPMLLLLLSLLLPLLKCWRVPCTGMQALALSKYTMFELQKTR